MSAQRAQTPLRVPELGPHLGKLVVGTGERPGGLPLDGIRFRLVTRVMECAGEARRLAGRDELIPALAAAGRAAWLDAWEHAVREVTDLLVTRVNQDLEAQGRAVRMPERRRRRLAIDAEEQRVIGARLGSTGARLIGTLDQLEDRAAQVSGGAPDAMDAALAWQETLTASARRLEEAWLALEADLALEVARWTRRVDEVGRWRKPWWPVVMVAMVALPLATWIGLMVGGYLAVPDWVGTVLQAVMP
jgi:hypothetical protein